MKMSKLILLLVLSTAALIAKADDDSLPEGSSVKVEKCNGKCFSNVADPNFPDSNTPNIVNGVLDGNKTPDLNDPKAQKDI